MTHVSIEGLTKVYAGTDEPSVDDLSLEIESGELAALLGPSGCGKTTTMKMIAGLLAPTAGNVAFDGRSVLSEKPENRGVVMVFQNYLLFPYMSVADNIGFGLKMRKVPKPEIARRVGEMLDLVRLPDLGARRPKELSGGQQQRVALARALIVQPKVLLLDEPLSNLDAHLRFEMRDLIRGLQQEMGITTIFVTHDQEEAVVLADRIALILKGALKQYDTPEAFYRRPVDVATARFFGGQNFVRGRAEKGVFEGAIGTLALPPDAREGEGTLTFRPENIRAGAAATDENRLSGLVKSKIYLGTQTRLRLEVGGVVIEVLANPNDARNVTEGETVPVSLPAAALVDARESGRTAMKFGIHSGLWMARWTDTIDPIVGTVADIGFDGIEVSLLGMTDEKAAALGTLARDHGLEVTCSDGLSREADITSPDPEVRAAGLEYLRWAVRTTAAMGSRGLAGVVYAPWGVFDPPNRAERAKRAAEAFAALDPDLERHDVTLGIEAINRFETDLVNTAAEATALAEPTSGSSRVGVLLDTFHMNMEEKDIAGAIVSSTRSPRPLPCVRQRSRRTRLRSRSSGPRSDAASPISATTGGSWRRCSSPPATRPAPT